MKFTRALSFILLIVFISCNNTNSTLAKLENIRAELKKEYAPDKRVELFDIQFESKGARLVVSGETTTEKALTVLLDSLKNLEVEFYNKVRVLPDTAVGDHLYALGNNSVINIRSKPKHAAELGTQGLLGMELRVLDKKGEWYRVQTPDNYISWVDHGGVELVTQKELADWNKATKVIYTQNFGYVYEKPDRNSTRVSDITFGGILTLKKEHDQYFELNYPDGRTGFVNKQEAVFYNVWLQLNPSDAAFIEESAKSMLGIPYLWGGTSTKGNDCSGFTKTVFLMNGFIIPRDASQQVHAGEIVDKDLKFEGLEKGDLMFFGTPATKDKKERVTHVGIWLGNGKGEFIHSAQNVHLSSIHKEQPHYDAFNKNRYLGSRRYLGVKDNKIISLKELHSIKH